MVKSKKRPEATTHKSGNQGGITKSVYWKKPVLETKYSLIGPKSAHPKAETNTILEMRVATERIARKVNTAKTSGVSYLKTPVAVYAKKSKKPSNRIRDLFTSISPNFFDK